METNSKNKTVRVMRRILFFLAFTCPAIAAKAQMVVSDPGNTFQAILQVKGLADNITELKEQKNKLDESLDFMRKLNNTIRDCETVKSILERQNRLNSKCLDLLSGKYSISASTLRTLTGSVEQITSNNGRLIKLSRTILSNSVKMNDSERLAMLQSIEEQTRQDERTLHKVGRVINEYEQLKRALD